jgi:ABC-type phosphate transport system substrate-binding protein
MKFLSARGIVPACVISAAAAFAMVVPGTAGASLGAQCTGSNVEGAGSTLQEEAIDLVWAPDFNTDTTSLKSCHGGPGLEPKITYRGVGSGAGFKEWSEKELFGTVGFVATDNTVNPAEKSGLEAKGTVEGGGKVLTIPVAQGSVAIIINLPEGCAAESTAAKYRLALNQSTLEEIYNDEVTEWGQIKDDNDKFVGTVLAAKIAKVKTTEHSAVVKVTTGGFPGVVVGDEVTGSGITAGTTVVSISGNELTLSKEATKTVASDTLSFKTPCNTSAAIKTVVREDGSGTTHIFKRFLHWSNEGTLTTGSGSFNWNELSEASHSTLWPTGVGAIKGNGGKGVVQAVETNPGSIGYANLADARNSSFSEFMPPAGGEKKQKFWAVIQNSATPTYSDPSSNKDVAARAAANCKSTEYSNGVASFPPPSVESAWNEVTTKQFSKTYPICGLTYDLAFANYRAYSGTTSAEATTVHDYLAFVLDAKGGQKEINAKHDYLALPKQVLTKSLEGVLLINYLP